VTEACKAVHRSVIRPISADTITTDTSVVKNKKVTSSLQSKCMPAINEMHIRVLGKHDKSKVYGGNPFPPDRAKGGLSHLHRHLLTTGTALLLTAFTADL